MTEALTIDEKARRAKAILEDPVFIDACQTIKTEQLAAITDSQPGDTEKREHSYHLLHALDTVIYQLQNYMTDAKVASKR